MKTFLIAVCKCKYDFSKTRAVFVSSFSKRSGIPTHTLPQILSRSFSFLWLIDPFFEWRGLRLIQRRSVSAFGWVCCSLRCWHKLSEALTWDLHLGCVYLCLFIAFPVNHDKHTCLCSPVKTYLTWTLAPGHRDVLHEAQLFEKLHWSYSWPPIIPKNMDFCHTLIMWLSNNRGWSWYYIIKLSCPLICLSFRGS